VFIHLIRFPVKHWFLHELRGCHVKLSQCSRAAPRPLLSVNPYSYRKSRANLNYNLVLFYYTLTAFTSDYCPLLIRVDCCRLSIIIDLIVPHSLTPNVFCVEIPILPPLSSMDINKSRILIPLHAYLSLELFQSVSPSLKPTSLFRCPLFLYMNPIYSTE
jgi:hypothetical protein